MNFAVSIAPILTLIFLMTKPKGWPSHIALPLTALIVYLVKLLHFADDPNLINATVVAGLLSAWTPILIIAGAILMFKTMERSGAMGIIRRWLNGVSDNRVAQLMIVAWSFAFVIEGASGFGTPAALAAPILVGMGFAPLRVAVLCLIMNSVPVSFGAVGTPTWFGMGQLGLNQVEMLRVGFYSAMIHAIAAVFIPPIALLFVVELKEVWRNIRFVYISIVSCVLPYVLLSWFSYEFPALIGGACGFLATLAAANWNIGLSKGNVDRLPASQPMNVGVIAKATFPLWGAVLVLVITRIPELGIKSLLTDKTPAFEIPLGSLGQLGISRAAVITLARIFGTTASWTFETLYVPAFIPFLLISMISFMVYRLNAATARDLFCETWQRMAHTTIALFGALVLVKLLMVGEDCSMVMIIGKSFANATGDKWGFSAPFLGALGSFFSGSATISNLTFSGIQNSIAAELHLDSAVILSMQSVGAALGNMISINNIVAVCSILGISHREGEILRKTIGPMLFYGVIAAVIGLCL